MDESTLLQSRRRFVQTAALGAAALVAGVPELQSGETVTGKNSAGFKLKYAPPFGMFEQHAGKDLLDQIKFMADQGFRAMFDNGLMDRTTEVQEAIAKETGRRGMEIGPFVAYADFSVKSFVAPDSTARDLLGPKLKAAAETSKRTHASTILIVPGRFDESLDWEYQTANVIENLKWCAGQCEKTGLIIVIEPLNPKNHPGLFLTRMSQAFQIVRAVGSPACKIVDDIYHQQITEGNIIPNIDACWDSIGAFHLGDTPGRNEPGTGELNFTNIFRHIQAKEYQGVLCMEHGKSRKGKEGELAVIDAYRTCDNS